MRVMSQVSQSAVDLGVVTLLTPKDRSKCIMISDVINIQCILVLVGATSVLACFWTPDVATMDYDKLVRIMYLFDSGACGYKLKLSKALSNLRLSNDTRGFNVRPIQWTEALNVFSTELAATTRLNIKISLFLHGLWSAVAILTRVSCQKVTELKILKIVLAILFYSIIAMVLFDVSMALVYVSHIKQSLTKSMVLRYSGWSSTLKLNSYDDFAGWLPIVASLCWVRGVIILFVNIYCCKILRIIRKRIMKREIKKKYDGNENYSAIPEPRTVYSSERVLIFRPDEQISYGSRIRKTLQ